MSGGSMCASVVSRYLPDFEYVWTRVKDNEMWSRKNHDMFVWLCKEAGIEPNGSTDKHFEIAEKAYDDTVERAKESYEQVTDFIVKEFAGKDNITVYRSVFVQDVDEFVGMLRERGKSNYQGMLHGVGIYWAWSRDKAISYCRERGKGDYEVILVAVAGCEDIDFNSTVLAFLTFSEGSPYDCESDENEITFKGNREITLVEYIRDEDGETGEIDRDKTVIANEKNPPKGISIWT